MTTQSDSSSENQHGQTLPDEGWLDVFLGADRNYLPHLATTVTSLLETNSPHIGRVFLLTSDISPGDLSRLNSFLEERYGVKIESRFISPRATEEFWVSGHVSSAAYLRFFAALHLPEEVSVALYLDCDTAVIGDLAGLRELVQELQENSQKENPTLAWAWRESMGLHLQRYGFTSEHYFNSGVMLINLQAWRGERLHEALDCYAKQLYERLPWWDQDVLNLALQNRWKPLGPEFNATWKVPVEKPVIVHFSGTRKPWHFGCPHPYAAEYRKYRTLTPYSPFRKERLGTHLYRTLTPRWWRARRKIGKKLARKLGRYLQQIRRI